MKNHTKNLTATRVKKLKTSKRHEEFSDTEVKGLCVRVARTGYKSFVYRYRFGEKVRRYTIGPFPEISLSQARDKARELIFEVQNGIDPQEEKMRLRYQPKKLTVNELAEEFCNEYLPSKRPTTRKTYKSRINKIIEKLGHVEVKELNKTMVKRFLKNIATKHPTNANRIQAIFSSMLTFAQREDYIENHPIKGMRKIGGKEEPRNPTYSNKEIKDLWDSFDDLNEPFSSLFKYLLVCGQRVGETSRMKWEDIDTDNALWIIPKSETKGDQTHIVPLSEMAIEILEKMYLTTGNSEYVFASVRDYGKPVRYFKYAKKKVRNNIENDAFQIHDLRHIVITGMISLGIDFVHVGKTVAHKGLGKDMFITTRYSHYEYLEEKKKALDLWSNKLSRIIAEKEKAKVFKIG